MSDMARYRSLLRETAGARLGATRPKPHAETIRCQRCGRTHSFVRKGLAPNDWPKWCGRCDEEINADD